ncbi:MAG: C39 family peptidase [Gammaproteobacteria bacterium]|nr:C39 family peptidase [Gammaproteobacteria bacterium]
MSLKPRLLFLTLLLLACTLPSAAMANEQRSVRSLLEIRQDNVVMQEWDLSCGAATLTTLLNYQHGDLVTEKEVATALMNRDIYIDNPLLVQIREGFSLFDLKRYVDQRGYKGVGLGRLKFDDLVARAPILVPINTSGYNHFVIFRGVLGNRVLLADPAWGNRTMTRDQFDKAWIEFGRIGRVGFVVESKDNVIASQSPGLLKPTSKDFPVLY